MERGLTTRNRIGRSKEAGKALKHGPRPLAATRRPPPLFPRSSGGSEEDERRLPHVSLSSVVTVAVMPLPADNVMKPS